MGPIGWIVVGVGILIALRLVRGKKPRPQPSGVVIGPLRPLRFSVFGALVGLVKIGVIFSIYTAVTTPIFASPPSLLLEWWFLAILLDLVVFCVVFRVCIPKDYASYMDRKPKGQHSPLDYFVGLVLSVVCFGGIGVHLMAISQAPGWELLS